MITQHQINLMNEWFVGRCAQRALEKKREPAALEFGRPFAKLNGKCFNCGLTGECQAHHVVPRTAGGVATVELCLSCHAKVHDRSAMTSSALTRFGMRKAKALGVRFGRESVVTREQEDAAKKILAEFPLISVTRLSKQMGLSLGTASRLRQRILGAEVSQAVFKFL